MPGTADPIAVFWDHSARCLGKMGIQGSEKMRLAKLWERTSTIRSRFRKGKPWLRMTSTEEGDVVVDTASLVANHVILQVILRTCGLTVPSIPEMTNEVHIAKLYPTYIMFSKRTRSWFLTKGGPDILDYLLLLFDGKTMPSPWRSRSFSIWPSSPKITANRHTWMHGICGGSWGLPFVGNKIAWKETKLLEHLGYLSSYKMIWLLFFLLLPQHTTTVTLLLFVFLVNFHGYLISPWDMIQRLHIFSNQEDMGSHSNYSFIQLFIHGVVFTSENSIRNQSRFAL